MKKYNVELRIQHPNGKIGCDCTIKKVYVNAHSHKEAKSIAEIRHDGVVLSTEVVND